MIEINQRRMGIFTDIYHREILLRAELEYRAGPRADIFVKPEAVPAHIIEHSGKQVEVAVAVNIGEIRLIESECHERAVGRIAVGGALQLRLNRRTDIANE